MGIPRDQLKFSESTLRDNPHLRDVLPEHQLPMDTSKPTKADERAEKKLQSECEKELHRRKIAYLHLSPRAREKKGWPDLTFALKLFPCTYPVAVELKSKSGKLSQDQVRVLTQMHENGWRVFVMRDMKSFIDLLNGHCKTSCGLWLLEWTPDRGNQ